MMRRLQQLVTILGMCGLLVLPRQAAFAQTCEPIGAHNLNAIAPYAVLYHDDPVALAWSPDSQTLAFSARGEIGFYSPTLGETRRALTFELRKVGDFEFLPVASALDFSDDGSMLAFTLGTLNIFDMATTETRILDDFSDEFLGTGLAVDFNGDSTHAAVMTGDGVLLLVDIRQARRISQVAPTENYVTGNVVLYSRDSGVLIDAVDSIVTFRNPLTLEALASDTPVDQPIRDLALTSNDRILAGISNNYASGRDRAWLTFWDMSTFERLRSVVTYGGSVSLSFSPNDDLMAMGSAANIYLWDLRSTTVLDIAADEATRVLEEHVGDVESIAFSPDGRFLASASVDFSNPTSDEGTIIVWGVCS